MYLASYNIYYINRLNISANALCKAVHHIRISNANCDFIYCNFDKQQSRLYFESIIKYINV